jgi:RHS repeat-associated protein
VRTTSSYGNPYLYTGRRLDDETGLYYYRARYYDVELGRFLGRDPIGYLGSEWNLYEYVDSSPTGSTDPFGEVGAGGHHGYPLHLGGAMSQPTIPLSKEQHKAAHAYLRSKGFGFGDAGRASWKALTGRQQQAHIMRSLRAANVSNQVIKTHIGEIVKGANPGIKTPRIGSAGKVIALGTVASAALIVLTDADAAYAPEISWNWRNTHYIPSEAECTCECADFRYTLIVPSWWNLRSDTEEGIAIKASSWADYGDMTRRECRDLEGFDTILSEESEVGFTVYSIETSICRFGGSRENVSGMTDDAIAKIDAAWRRIEENNAGR